MEAKKQSPLKRAWMLAESSHGRLKFSIFLAIIGVLAGMVPYVCAGKIIELMLMHENKFESYIPWIVIAFAGGVGKVLFTTWSTSESHIATFGVLAELRTRCVHKLSNLSMGTLERESVGRWKSILVDQIESMETTLAHLFPEVTSNIVAPIVLLIILFTIDWRLTLIGIVTLPIGMMCMMMIMKSYPEQYAKSVRIGKTMNDAIVEYVDGIEVIKAFNQGDKVYGRYEGAVKDNAQFFCDWMKSAQIGVACCKNISPSVLLGILPAGIIFYLNGSLTTTNFLMVIIMAMGVVGPILAAMDFVDSLAQVGTIIESVECILDAKEQHHPQQNVTLHDTTIKLDNVSFEYEKESGEVLHDVNLQIKAGTVNALVGPSGSGKSTIAKLIAGFWDVEKGSISIGGKNLNSIPLAQINDMIAYVTQDNFLFDDTIRENIRTGKENATDKEVEEIAKEAGCHEFICKLENGYDTRVGGGGTHLSGGERQRIALARAMLKDAPIVILDEATAYIDPENEAIIQKAISKLVEGKTLIMIAHRLSTIKDADQIIIVNDGSIEATGTHEELLKNSKLYESMWTAHIGSKEGEK